MRLDSFSLVRRIDVFPDKHPLLTAAERERELTRQPNVPRVCRSDDDE